MTPLALDLSRQWGWMDLWPTDAFWNVPRDLPVMDVAVVALVLGLLVFAIKKRKGR